MHKDPYPGIEEGANTVSKQLKHKAQTDRAESSRYPEQVATTVQSHTMHPSELENVTSPGPMNVIRKLQSLEASSAKRATV